MSALAFSRWGRECRCEHPILVREPGEEAECLKCGHRLGPLRPQDFGTTLVGEQARQATTSEAGSSVAEGPAGLSSPSREAAPGDELSRDRVAPAVSGQDLEWPFPLAVSGEVDPPEHGT